MTDWIALEANVYMRTGKRVPRVLVRGAGCRVWDMDGREFIDMSLMGIGTNTLGYGHPEVDDAVRAVVEDPDPDEA